VVGPQGQARRADIVMFLNGLPLGVVELKNPADERATISGALNQLQTYGAQTAGREEPGGRWPSIVGARHPTLDSCSGCYVDP